MRVPVSVRTRYFMADKKALVDSGATDNFIHPAFAKRLGIAMTPLEKPKRIYNIDNTTNKSGSITHSLELKVTTKGIKKVMRFLVTDIGNEDILLGYPWLATFEPKFGWKDAIIETQALPIVITSTIPVDSRLVITGLQTDEEKHEIMRELEETTTIREESPRNWQFKQEKARRRSKYQRCTTASNDCSVKKHPNDFPHHVHGITQSTSNPTHQTLFHAGFIR